MGIELLTVGLGWNSLQIDTVISVVKSIYHASTYIYIQIYIVQWFILHVTH